MKPRLTTLAAALIGSAIASQSNAAPVGQDDFQVQTAAHLVALCSADQADPLYTAARNFCHGFTVATVRAIVMEQMATRAKHKMFCLPANQPTRDQATAAFVTWANARPKTLASGPTDGIVEYLVTQYPCP
jgi:Rap1a immunity proteins